MRIEFLIEEPSAEEALKILLPKVLRKRADFKLINLGSKYKLLRVLDARLRAYRQRVDSGEDLRVVVLVDRDDDDCRQLKQRLDAAARSAGLLDRTESRLLVVNRILIEELESWFIGDPLALRQAFSSLPAINERSGIFRNPDNGGSWEALHRFLKKHGVYRSSYPKIEAARKIAQRMEPTRNRSPSFHAFISGIERLLT